MSFVSFPYQFKMGKKNYSGSLDTFTGMFAGGSVKTTTTTSNNSTTTSHTTTVNVRAFDGKVKSVVVSGKINLPDSSMITIFYYPKGGYIYPFKIYVHDTEKLYSLGKNEVKGAVRAVSGWGVLRRLWGRLMDTTYYILILVLSAGLAMYLNYQNYVSDIVSWVIFFVGLFAAAIILNRPIAWLGGTSDAYTDFGNALNRICFDRAYEIEDGLSGAGNGTMLSAYGDEEQLIASSNTEESGEFKPMF